MRHWLPELMAGLVVIGGTLLAATAFLALRPPPWHSREHVALALWSLPPALATAVVARVLRRRLAGVPAWRRAMATAIVGFLLGVGWAFASYFISGGYVMAFDVPVLYCWTTGTVFGLLLALFWRDMGSSNRPGGKGRLTTGSS